MKEKNVLVIAVLGVCAFIIFVASLASLYQIDAGERGILLTFGKPDPVPKTEGLHYKTPFVQSIVKMDVKTQKYSAQASASSKDLQIVSTEIATNYHLVPEQVTNLYTEIGIAYQDRVIQPTVQEVVKASTAQFTAEELITKRPVVKDRIVELLRERLSQRGIVVEEVSITNFDFSGEFNKAIEQKVTAEQLKLKAANDLERIKIEAEQKIATAKAEAEALRLQKEQITPELVRLREIDMRKLAVEKWDGVLPQYTGGVIPFLDVGVVK